MDEHTMRRQPRQARGQERVDALLDAALSLFSEIGYEAATTNAIAARAGARIGSLYHYFPNKEAILEALKERFMTELAEVYRQAATPDELRHLPASALMDRVIDAIVRFDATHDGFASILYGSPAPNALQASASDMQQRMVAFVESMLAVRLPQVTPADRSTAALLMVSATKAALTQMRADTSQQARILSELKRMLSAYLALYDAQS